MAHACMVLLSVLAGVCTAQDARDLDPAQNIALGKQVSYCPTPNYGLTAKGDTDPDDLTDGQLTKREDQHLWFESGAVGYSYGGRVNLSVDLGEVQPIEEVAIRLLGGSPQAGVTMPGWVEVMVSDGPEQPYYRVAEFSKWREGDRDRFAIPRCEGKAWVHRLRFTGLKASGRCVGIRMYTAGLTCADEMYVFRGDHDVTQAGRDASTLSDFTVTGGELYFHKPVMHVTSNIATPVPIGCIRGPSEKARPMTVTLNMPEGVEVLSGSLGGVAVADAGVSPGANGTVDYVWKFSSKSGATKVLGRLYVKGAPKQGAKAQVGYTVQWGDYQSPPMVWPIEVIEIPRQPKMPQRLMTSLSWGANGMAQVWPDWRQAYRCIGFNTLAVASQWLKPDDQQAMQVVEEARQAGLRIQMIDSTWHSMLSRHKREPELYAQFADGSHGTKLCPSYRGKYYEEEMQRMATAARLLRPSYVHCDIELWGWRGPVDAQKCTRCMADKQASGIESWEDWQLAKGKQMWMDLYEAVQGALKQVGAPPCGMAVYDFRPGKNYQFFWPFDQLYPEYMQTSQVSTYTPLDPYHIELIGDEARADREKLEGSDQIPWLTPGDAGTFSGEDFYYALLECFCNGSRGVNFWSNRVWDADCLAGYARAVRAVTPVEDVIVDGDLFIPEVQGEGRVSGMQSGDETVLLAADYHGDTDGKLRVKLDLDDRLRVRDLDSGDELAPIGPGQVTLEVALSGPKARILHLRP